MYSRSCRHASCCLDVPYHQYGCDLLHTGDRIGWFLTAELQRISDPADRFIVQLLDRGDYRNTDSNEQRHDLYGDGDGRELCHRYSYLQSIGQWRSDGNAGCCVHLTHHQYGSNVVYAGDRIRWHGNAELQRISDPADRFIVQLLDGGDYRNTDGIKQRYDLYGDGDGRELCHRYSYLQSDGR